MGSRKTLSAQDPPASDLWSFEEISEALLLDESTIRRYRMWYEEEGMDRLLNDDWGGSESRLREEQEVELAEYLDEHLFHTTSEVSEYVLAWMFHQTSSRGM